MFTPQEREELLAALVARARVDPSVTAAALVGSRARGETDRWSDIDLALRLHPGAGLVSVADAWGRHLADLAAVVDQFDIWAEPALYRVFLLSDSLQVDLSFWPADDFAGNGEPFALLFGEATASAPAAPQAAHDLVGWAWLYALHLRSALARGRIWQALTMLDGLRSSVVALICLRHQLPSHQGRGVDRLPADVLTDVGRTLASEPVLLPVAEAFAVACDLLLAEVGHLDPALATRLRPTLATLVAIARAS